MIHSTSISRRLKVTGMLDLLLLNNPENFDESGVFLFLFIAKNFVYDYYHFDEIKHVILLTSHDWLFFEFEIQIVRFVLIFGLFSKLLEFCRNEKAKAL